MTAVLHHLAPKARVVGIDHLPGLVELAKENLRKDGVKMGDSSGGVQIVLGDGRLGSPSDGARTSGDTDVKHRFRSYMSERRLLRYPKPSSINSLLREECSSPSECTLKVSVMRAKADWRYLAD